MVKGLSQLPSDPSVLQQQHKSPKPSGVGNPPDADSSSGALDLSQLNKDESPMPSRPQSGSQTSTQSGSGKIVDLPSTISNLMICLRSET